MNVSCEHESSKVNTQMTVFKKISRPSIITLIKSYLLLLNTVSFNKSQAHLVKMPVYRHICTYI